jgi:flagellar hook-length control protein FliK
MEKITASVSKGDVSAASESNKENQAQNGTNQEGSKDEISQPQNANTAETKAKEVKADAPKETSVKETVAAADNNKDTVNNQPASAVNQPQTDLKANAVSKADKPLPVSKSEIINQVVEKAKVLTNGEKSEMVIDLKPDSLGKLSLKVITERGIVTAQFVAESQQVKQVLESNMQLLKDSLEKQGLAVQNFSVSVGQQNTERRFGRNDGYSQENKATGNNKVNGFGQGKITTVEEVSSSTQRINPYDWTNSKINLTA